MLKHLLYFSFVILHFNFAVAQLYKGKVVNKKNEVVPFVTISFTDKNNDYFGSITNEKGTFVVKKYLLNYTDSISFSCIGYKTKKIAILELNTNKENIIILDNENYKIDNVIVYGKKEKNKIIELGTHKNITDGGDFFPIWEENALYIENDKNIKGYLKNINIKLTNKPNLKIPLRVHVYSVDSVTHAPYKELLKESVVATTDNYKRKWISVDIRKYKIYFPKQGLFIGVQFLPLRDLEIYDSNIKCVSMYSRKDKPLRIQRGYVKRKNKCNTWTRFFRTQENINGIIVQGGKWYYTGKKGYYHKGVGKTNIIMSTKIVVKK